MHLHFQLVQWVGDSHFDFFAGSQFRATTSSGNKSVFLLQLWIISRNWALFWKQLNTLCKTAMASCSTSTLRLFTFNNFFLLSFSFTNKFSCAASFLFWFSMLSLNDWGEAKFLFCFYNCGLPTHRHGTKHLWKHRGTLATTALSSHTFCVTTVCISSGRQHWVVEFYWHTVCGIAERNQPSALWW